MFIKSLNSLQEQASPTYLANDEAAGTTVIRVKNTTGFTNGWAFQIGATGQDRTEVVLGTVTNVGTLSVAALDFDHPKDSPIFPIKYNQVVFEKSAAGTAGTAVPITDGTVEYQADAHDQQTGQSYTIFDDTLGTITDAYKTFFRNSALSVNSTESDWLTSAGFSFYSLGKLRQRVREKLWDSNFAQDNEIDNWINEWKDEMINSVISVNEDYSIGTVGVGFGTNGLGTITTTDFKQPRKVEITYDGGVTYTLSTKQHLNEFDPNQIYLSSHPYHNWQGDNVFKVQPADAGGTALIYFHRLGTPMVNDTDELPSPMRGYTKSFVDYGLSQAYQKDGKTGEAQIRANDANIQKQMFVNQSTPRDKSSTEMIELVENVSSEEDSIY